MDPFYDPEEETVATAKNGRPVSRYYSELSPGVFVENQAEGTFFRGADGRMQSSIRGRERRGLLDRVFGVDDPALANERTWMDNVADLPKTVGRSISNMAGNVLTGLGTAATGVSRTIGEEVTVKDEDGNVLQTRPYRNTERMFGAVGQDLQDQAQRMAPHPQQRGDFLTDALPSGLTQVAGQISLAALVGPAAAGGAMVSQAAGAGYQDAIASGASEETALLSAALNAPVGALEMLPVSRLFTRVNKATGGTFGQVVKRSLAEGVSGSLEEAITEAASQTLSNAVAQKLYDEDRELFAGVGDSSVQGGAVGFVASALGAGIAGFRRGNPNRPRPEMVDGEYIPPPEPVDAVWLSDERGVARRSGELMGPFPAPVADGISLRELTGKDEAGNALPSQPGRNLLPGNLSEVRLSDLVDVNAPVDESLTPEEVARLPISHIRARDNAESAPWVDEVEQTFEDRKQKILGRAGDKLSDTKHPIAQLRGWIRKAGGLRNDGGEIPPAFYNGISISYKNAGRKKSKRHWNDTGVTLEKVREWLAENAEEIGWQGDTQIDGGDLAQFLTGSFYDKSTGKSRFLTDDQKLGAMNLELEPRPLDRKLIEKVPVKVLFDRFNRDFKDTPYEIIPGDMEPGDILRIEDELYEVRKEGGVKVLVDGQTIELDPNEPVYVDAIVPKGHKMHKVFANLYQAVENRAARFPPDAMEAKAQEEAGLPPEVFDPTPAMDPDDIVPANASPEERAQRLDLYNQLLAAGRIRRRTPQSPTPAVDPRANLTAPGEVVTPVQADQGVSAPELAPAVGESLSRPSEPPAAGTSDVRNEPFSLEAVSPEQLDAEQAAQREAARVAREREKLREGVAAPLVGSTGDLGQGRLFDDGKEDLFSGPSAEELAAKKKRPDPTANMDEIADRIAAERKAREAEAKAAGPKRSGLFGWLEGVFRFEGQRLRSPEGEGPALFSSLDPDTEAALSRNEKPKGSPWYKADPKKVREFFRSFTRAFPEIPDAEHATGYYLEQMSHIPNAVTMISRGILGDIVTGLDAESYRLFQRVLVAKDLQKSMDDGLYEGKDIPFWKDRAALDADAANWDAVTAANPHVAEALERRQAFLGSLVQEAIRFDLLPEGTSAEGYFHRIVTEYLEQQPGPGQKGMKDSKAGFQKTRKGSDKEYVTDYLTAEHDVISSILAKIEQQKVLASIEALNDRAPALRREARRLNLIAAHGGEANYNRVRSVLNQVSGIKAEAELSGELDSSTRQEMALLMQSIEDIDVLRPFRGQKAMAISILERAMGRKLEDIDYVSDNPGDDGDPNMLMGAAIKGELGEAARGAAAVWFKAIAAEEKFIQENLGGRYFRWKNGDLDKRMIPEGYTAWRRSDNPRYFKALSISEHVAEQVMAEQRKLMDDDVKEILATAGLEPAWIVPEHVARALNRLGNDPNEGPVAGAMKKATGVWKGWALQAPTRVLKYNFNNLTGDADFAIAAAPGILTYVKKAQEISWNINIRKQGLDSTLRKLALNGVIGGQMRGELPKIRQDELFSLITGEKPHLWQKYWDKSSSLAKWREDILRISAYFYYSDAIRKGERPLGASNRDQVKALYDANMNDEAAMMLAKQSLIDYDNPTAAGEVIKNRAIPFYRFREGNLIRYKHLIENTWRESRQDADRARAAGPVFAKLFAKRAAFTGARIAAWSAIVAGMNAAFFPEEEEKLRKRGRRGHVIIGRNPDNPDEIYTMRMEGSLASFLSSLGVDEAMEQAGKVAAGDESLDGAARSVAASVVSDWVNSSNPFAKTAVEALAGISFWPDITNPRPIRDRAEHVLKLADADKLYNYVTGKPRDPRNNPLTSLLTFRTDMAEANYWVARANVMEWRKKQGMDTQPRSFTDQHNALYYYRKAQQYGDKRGEEHWLDRYLDLGGTVKGMRGSLDRQHPLSGLTQKQKSAYLTTLTEAQRKDLIRATKYYAEKLSARAVDPEVMQNVIERRRQQR